MSSANKQTPDDENKIPNSTPIPEGWDDLTTKQRQLVAVLSDKQQSSSEVQAESGLSDTYARALLIDLCNEGLAKRERNGLSYEYWLTKEGLVKFGRMGLIEPSKYALKDEEVYEAYHVGLNDRKEAEGKVDVDGDVPNVTIQREARSYKGPETGLDLTTQHFSERPVTDADLRDMTSEDEAFLTLELDEEQVFQIISGEPLSDEFRRGLFMDLTMTSE